MEYKGSAVPKAVLISSKELNQQLRSCDGGIFILWALLLPVIIGFIGFGVEMALWYANETELQSATDAAAIATAYNYGPGTTLDAVAKSEMARNGFDADRNINITTNHPPQSGAYKGNINAVEIIALLPQNLLFWRYAFSNRVIEIRARAVAFNGRLVE